MPSKSLGPLRAAVLTSIALLAFASNSILCRLALARGEIDPSSFTAIRILSGALALSVIVLSIQRRSTLSAGSWLAGSMLFVYAAAFSFAYVGLNAGTGALILFGSVQITMIAVAIKSQERPNAAEWVGLIVALGGLVYLTLPGLAAPPPDRAALMALAGAAWGIYSMRGRAGGDPVAATGANFLRAMPFAALLTLIFIGHWHGTALGIGLAVISGALTSGLGYVVWYAALPSIGATRAAIVQLAVPVLTAFVGIAVLGEVLSWRLVIAAALTLGGVGTAILGQSMFTRSASR